MTRLTERQLREGWEIDMTQQPPIAEGLQQVMGASATQTELSSPTEPEVSALRASIPSASEALERVAAVIAPHLRVSVGANPDCDTQNEAHDHALFVARAAIRAMKA